MTATDMTATDMTPIDTAPDTAGPPAATDVEPAELDEVGTVRVPSPIDQHTERARWERPALAGLLLATAALYLWNLSESGWGNSFYAAAAQAGSKSWTAWFFGSSDAANSITVDKPAASLWASGLAIRIFGLNSWSVLVPQALMGVATVGVVFAAVRRHLTARAAFLAGITLALTPVAALMFRFNNPDALLVLMMSLAAYTVLRGAEDGRRRWIVATGALIGFGFLAKQLQVLLVVPPLALAYLIAAPVTFRRRVTDLLLGGAAIVAAAGWWIAIVSLVPAGSRPFIGGSQDNSVLELTFGYNGFGRLTGAETGSVGVGGNGGGRWGQTGITRMFDGVIGGQIAWLIPAALLAIAVGLWCTRRAPRTDVNRAAVILWAGWLVVTLLVFSFMQGIFHEYYTVALAPAIAALVGIGADMLWRRRRHLAASSVLAAAVAITAVWSAALLHRAPDWNPWLRPVVLGGGLVTAALIAGGRWIPDRVMTVVGVAAAAVCLAGPAAWTLSTVDTAHTGSIVTAGPAVESGFGNRRPGGAGGFPIPGGFPGTTGAATDGQPTDGAAPGGAAPGGTRGGFPPGGAPPAGAPPVGGTAAGPLPTFGPGGNGAGGLFGGGIGGLGGLLDAGTPSDAVVAALEQNADDYTWVAAAIGSNRASGFQLATDDPVMPIGGFNGTDPSPTLAQFQEYVADGAIHWFIAGNTFGQSPGGSNDAAAISAWVEANFDSTTVDGVTLYDLTP